MERKCICFSDIDGTIVHYPKPEQLSELTGEILLLSQSTTGKTATLEKVAHLRRHGIRFVIVTGARTSTLLQRLPHLPAADAYVSENGGRVFYPDPDGLTAAPIREDDEWRASFDAVAGPASQDMLPPERREGTLWQWFRRMRDDGWSLDANSYSTAFRVKKTQGKTQEQLRAAIDARPAELACTFNVGVADFYPAGSGKEKVGRYLMQRWGVARKADSVHVCDDDNDLLLAAEVGRAFVPTIGSASMQAAIDAHPERFEVATTAMTGGSEQMLDAVAAYFGLPVHADAGDGGPRRVHYAPDSDATPGGDAAEAVV